MDRREFLKAGLGAASLAALETRSGLVTRVLGATADSRKVVILGFDGMDPALVQAFMSDGKLPAFRKLAGLGGFKPLGTSRPPQSPVAWSNFITGMDPGGHGIYDFIHRDPKTYLPVPSGTETTGAAKTVKLGKYILPVKSPEVRNLRRGRAFWQILEDHGIPSTIFKMPANYPPVVARGRTLSGMGTPDLLGTYGTLQYYTTEAQEVNEDIGGARVVRVYVVGNRVESAIVGPKNTFLEDAPDSEIAFRVDIDPVNPVAKISFQGQEVLLREKEWSGWKRLRFHFMPTRNVRGICMFYLKQVRPDFKLYVSPVNIDPEDPALPISTPPSYARELAERFGPYFTKGLPADTSALDNDILDEEEFLHQDDIVLRESREVLDYELGRFEAGALFFYLSSTDQRQHMFWRLTDPLHPAYDEKLAARYGGVIARTYEEMDRALDMALRRADRDTVVLVLSDHGFNSFRRGLNLNTWLLREGYHRLKRPWKQEESSLFDNTDWSKTRAYGVGLNSLYINERGREAEGLVAPGADKDNLVREIAAKLEALVDPRTGEHPVLKAFVSREAYRGRHLENAPDIVLGFNQGYRISWQSPLGGFPREILEDNTQKWSGDHMAAPQVLPGVAFANRKFTAGAPALYDLTASVLGVFGVQPPPEMIGRDVLAKS